MMKLISINVSKPKPIEYGGKTVQTGIFKEPVSGTVMLREKNIDGDGQGDLKVHGGTYKAIYGYPIEHYKALAAGIEQKRLDVWTIRRKTSLLKACWKKRSTSEMSFR